MHTRIQQLRVVPDEKNMGAGGGEGRASGGGALKAKHYIFVGGGGAVFFQSSGRLAFVKVYNFLQVVVLLKNAVLLVSFVQMRTFGSLGSHEKLSPGENTVLYPGKTRLKPRPFLPAILAGNLNSGTSSALPGLIGG